MLLSWNPNVREESNGGVCTMALKKREVEEEEEEGKSTTTFLRFFLSCSLSNSFFPLSLSLLH